MPSLSATHPLINPFLLHPSSVKLSQTPSSHPQKAIWLHMPVMVRRSQPQSASLQLLTYLSHLRHPNLEQFLGVVFDKKHVLLVTEDAPGLPLRQMITSGLPITTAISIALDLARALLYIRATTKREYYPLSTKQIMYNRSRNRAILLLPSAGNFYQPTKGCKHSVHSLSKLLLQMCPNHRRRDSQNQVSVLPKMLQRVVAAGLKDDPRSRPKLEILCESLQQALEML